MATNNDNKRETAAKPRLPKDRVGDLLTKAIEKFEAEVDTAGFHPSLAEYFKLIQLKKELDEETEEAKEIKVTWVETEEMKESENSD